MGHKVASTRIAAGRPVIKYGHSIGLASRDIQPGEWVHVHNVQLDPGPTHYEFATEVPPAFPPDAESTFQGYRRHTGKTGTRNYLAVISNVNCSASVSKCIAREFTPQRLRDYPQVDGVAAFTHHSGCAIKFTGQQHQILDRVMGGVARHPNIGGFVLIGLGCEKATLDHLIQGQGLVQLEGAGNKGHDVPAFTMQALGGTARTIEQGIRVVAQMLPAVNDVRRETLPASELILATQCGGSDGSSGITANPALGWACDRIVACGGTAILGETTEIAGAEQLMTRRAVSKQVGQKLLHRIAWWRWYAGLFGEQLDDNRSEGNAEGGLTTITEKSLGAIAKGGTSRLVDVYDYAAPIDKPGLVIMDSPGFDPCSLTGMVASGANLIAFTTGRGSCYGCKPTPSIKIASNNDTYRRLQDDMDLNAGCILEGEPLSQVGDRIFREMLSVASGKKTKSERLGLGDEEFVPWLVGPVL
jgi:altronate dehydratase